MTAFTDIAFGPVTPALVGIAMRYVAIRAMRTVRHMRFTFTKEVKGVKPGGRLDWVTDADQEAQKIYVVLLREAFPLIGIVAEEMHLRHPCTIPGHNVYFTVDPIDGTAAFTRKQSDSISTMICLVADGEIISVCIGDIMSGEFYFYRPESGKTHRIDLNDEGAGAQPLVIDETIPLAAQCLLLREPPDRMRSADIITKMVAREGGLFRTYQIHCGSVGTTTAKIWKSEMGGTVLSGRESTPWDDNPLKGISTRLGFVGLSLCTTPIPRLVEISLAPNDQVVEQPNDLLLIHKSRLVELLEWCILHKITVVLLEDQD